MNSTPRDARGPGHRECLLPSVTRTPSVTQVTPAKKITFLKRGDPRFAGVRLAVHQRAFRSFGALMDELSQRVPLSFGVRSVTTPRGLHGLSALEQLQDGGCYLCSDKKPPKTPGELGQPRGRSHSAQQSREFEAPGTASTCKGLKASRRITLVKNGDPRLQQTVVLSHRNTRSLMAFLSKASDLLRFPVKHVYTTSGKRLDSLKALLRSPSVLVCAGLEPFRPLAMEDIRRKGSELSSGQTSRNKSGSWGPKAKQSVIHARSRLENRSRQFSLMSERSGLSDPTVCPHRACMCPAPDRHPLNTPARLGPLVAGEDIEKNVSVNEDGSLSVEMKVRFHLLGEDPLLWSRRLGGASTLTVTCGEGPDAGEEDLLGCVWKGHSGDPSEPGAQGLGPCEAGGVGAFDQGQRQPGSSYEIWMNPLYTSQREWSASRWRSGLTQNSHSRAPRSQRIASRKRGNKDRVSPASSDRPPGGSEPNSSCCSGSLEDAVASGAGEGRGEGAALGRRDHDGCLKPRTHGLTDALPDSSESAGSQEECSERDKLSQGRPSKTSRRVTQQGVPGSPTVNPSSIGNEDPQAEAIGQGVGHPQARNRSRVRPRSARGPAGSGDDAGGYTPSSACASALDRSRKQESRASALSSPSISVLSRGAQRARPRQQHNPKDMHCPLDPPVSRPTPRPSGRDRAHPHGPPPSLSESPQGTWNLASRDPGAPFSASRYSPDTRGLSSIPITPGSNSDCVSNFYLPNSPSAETEVGPEFRPCSPAPTPSDTSGPFSAPADGLGEKTGGDRFQPSWPLVLPAGWPEGGRLGAHWASSCSHLGTPLARGSSCGTMRMMPAPQPQGGQGPSSKACWLCSRYCPTPPRTRPSGKRHPSGCRSEGDRSADGEPGGGKVGEEKSDAWHPRPPGSQGAASGRAVRAVRRSSPRSGPQLQRMAQGKLSGRGGGQEEREEGGGELLRALPRASPDAVVRAWLSNIPEETMKHELEDKGEDVVGHDLEGPQEDPVGKHSPDGPEGSVWAGQLPLEQAASEEAEPEEVFPVASRASPKSAEGLPCRGVSETPPEAGTSKGVAVNGGRGQRVLPSRVSTSLQIMKALMGSRPGRPSSLPEVSHSEGRRLSRSAQALITCLARLHFFDDDDLGSPASKVRFTDSPRYQQLLSTFQALWPGSGLRNSELESDLRELGWRQALPALGPHVATEDFRPTSSSGVDVGSGSGGSGEGSGPCTMDCSLVSEKMELPLSISCQGPDSKTSVNPAVPGNRPLSSNEAEGAASEDRAEKNGREQMLGSDPDQGDKNTMEEEGVQLEEIKEGKERAELQVEGVRGFLEEEGIMELELSGAGSQDGAGVWENKSLHEEEPGDPTAVATQSPSGRRWSPTEPPRSLSRSKSGPKAEPPLEKLLGAAEPGCGQTLDKLTQGAGETGTCKARRGSLISDPMWVSKLLKKMEKTFMDHLATATAELCTRWGLQGEPLLDQMVAELQRDVNQRLQDSVEKELLKVQNWAGGAGAGPPREALRWEASLQTEQRRRRLQALRNLSPFSEQTRGRGPPSFSLEDLPVFRGALGSQLGVEAKGEEFCPCEACVRRKMVPAPPVDAVGSASAPIRKAFDLQHILQKKKGGCADGETAEVAPAVEREAEPLHRDPSRTGTVRGADGDPEPGSGQGLGKDEDPWGTEEEAGAQGKEGQTEPYVGSDPWEGLGRGEQGMGGEEGDLEAGCGAEDTEEAHARGGGGPGPGGQEAGAGTTEAREAAREKGSETGGGCGGDEEGGPQVGLGHGQSREASGDRSPSPGADPPQQRSGPRSGLSSFSTSSLGNCSLLSQKGSEDEPWDRCMRSIEDQATDIPDPERKVTGMYPESSASEQEGAPSCSRTPERGTGEGLSSEQSKEGGLASEQEIEEGQAPEQEGEECPAPEEGEKCPAPEQEGEEGLAPEEGEEGPAPEEGEGGPAPEQEGEEGPAPEQEGDEGPAPEEGEKCPAPEQEGEEGLAPEEGEEGPAPEQDEEEGPAPEQEGEECPAPEEGEKCPAPEQEGEEGLAPEEGEEGPAPEQEGEEGPAPEEGEGGLAPEQEGEEGPAPEQEGDEGPAPEEGEKCPAPEQEGEEGLAPEEGEEGPAPEQDEEEGLAPEQEEEEGPAPEQEGEEGPASEQEGEECPAPEEGEKCPAPEQEGEEGLAPEEGEEGPAPEQEGEEGLAPEQEEEEGPAPEQEGEEGPASEQEGEEGPAPEEGEESLAPEEGEEGPAPEEGEECPAPEQEEEEGLAPEQEEEEGPAPEQEEEKGPASEQEGEEGPAPEEGEEGPAPEEGEEGSAPEQEEEEGPAPEEGEECPAPEQEGEEGPAPEQEEEEGPVPEQEGEEGLAPEQEGEEGPVPEQEGEESPAPEEGEEGPAPEQETEEGSAPEQEEEEDPAPEEGEEGPAPEQEGDEGPAPEEGEEGPAPEQEGEEGPAPEEGDEGPGPEQEEEEGPAPEQETKEGSDLEAKKVVKHLASTETRFRNLPMDQTDGFDEDDLDF